MIEKGPVQVTIDAEFSQEQLTKIKRLFAGDADDLTVAAQLGIIPEDSMPITSTNTEDDL